jgi:NhaA family Na+:H+ antiporter
MTKKRKRQPANHWSQTPLARIISPMQSFIGRSEASGIILLSVTILALIVANSPLYSFYDQLLHSYIGISVGPFELKESVLHWVNDGLMVLFFFLVGLEIKRELLVGALSNLRAAMLPILAACGGAIVPALIYMAFNAGLPSFHGWGVPMATDIAFALGVLALLGSRVPFGLKVFLTAVAIVDDLIAVLVIALFYSSGLNFVALGLGFAFLLVLAMFNWFGFRRPSLYAIVGVLVWLCFLKSGIHATIAGVLVAFTIPARNRIDLPTFLQKTQSYLSELENSHKTNSPMLTDEAQQHAVLKLEKACEYVQAPLQKMEHSLNTFITFGIMPIFAFANAGVALGAVEFDAKSFPLMLGIAVGLIVGKPIGIVTTCWLANRFNIASLPEGVSWNHIFGVGVLAGIGFTMSLFVASLSFEGEMLGSAKISILLASTIAGLIGYALLARSK